MDKFLEKYNFPKPNQEEIENLNRLETSTEVETVIRNLPTNKAGGGDGIPAEIFQILKDDAVKVLHSVCQ